MGMLKPDGLPPHPRYLQLALAAREKKSVSYKGVSMPLSITLQGRPPKPTQNDLKDVFVGITL